jgi:dipeptidyl aminopeptidase/acylaminoacyl peptidase
MAQWSNSIKHNRKSIQESRMARRPVALEDLLRFQVAGDTQISPDGRRIVFTVRRIDEGKNKYFTRLWMADTETGEARPFTGDGHNDGQPRWSPDGAQIAFVSDRGSDQRGSQIYLIAPDGGEASALTKLEEGEVSEIAWSPDGARIAFLFRATPPERTKKAEEERKEKGLSSPVRVHTRLFYRLDGFGYFDGSFPQVWVADVKTGETKPLTDEPYYHASLTWSPDGKTLAFITNRRDDWDLKGMYDDIWTYSGFPRRTAPSPAWPGRRMGAGWPMSAIPIRRTPGEGATSGFWSSRRAARRRFAT